MSTHKHIDKICVAAVVISLIISILFMNGEALGIQAASKAMGYEERLFDTSKVHTIDIIIDDWDAFLDTAQSEEYSACSVVIDGETISNVGIRGKGNTSLSTVAGMNSDRYSFKIEFDQYDSTKSYHGLDKLSLNNVIQDNTYMKDYLTYQMMNAFGAASPLCSYAYITVNGEEWGLYLAVEAVEESFLQRNYGNNYGDLYKPDSMEMGGGRGNGRDFEMPDFTDRQENTDGSATGTEANDQQSGMAIPEAPPTGNSNAPAGDFGGGFSIAEEAIRSAFEKLELDTSMLDSIDFENITMENLQTALDGLGEEVRESVMQEIMANSTQKPGMDEAMQIPDMGGGMGSSETKLQYIDDDPDSYSTIFDSAKTNVTEADKNRLVASLKQLSEYRNLEEVVSVEDVLRYFVVHNYVVNGDSYTGSMIHNYYLYEEDGRLSMIPWDYNLAFGTFQGGNAASAVNDDIDEMLSDRPMQAWIFSDEMYSQQYYSLYAEMLDTVDIQGIIDSAYELIAPYVEKDPTAFCTYVEFQTGVASLKEFCSLRSESVRLQLSGSTEAVETGTLDLSDMGTMNHDRGGISGRGERGSDSAESNQDGTQASENIQQPGNSQSAENGTGAENGNTGASNAGDSLPDGIGDFGNFSPPGEMPDFGSTGSFNGMMNNGQRSGSTETTAIFLAASVLLLAFGLIVAFKFKR